MLKIVLAVIAVGVLFLMFRRLVWRLSKSEGTQSLPSKVKGLLASQFSLEPAALASLRCRIKNGRYSGESVRYLGVFDPALVKDEQHGRGSYKGLVADKAAFLFEVRMWPDGAVFVEDRRAGQAAF